MTLLGGAGISFLVLLGSVLAAGIHHPSTARANDADRIPYQSSCTDPVLASGPASGGVNIATFSFAPAPPGYRLVVENVSAVAPATQPGVPIGVLLYGAVDGVERAHPALYFPARAGADAVAHVDENTVTHFGPSSGAPKLQLTLAAGGLAATPMAILTGYLEPVRP